MDLAQKQLQKIFRTKLPSRPSRKFEELIYTWLRLPRPARNAFGLSEYDILWWVFFQGRLRRRATRNEGLFGAQ